MTAQRLLAHVDHGPMPVPPSRAALLDAVGRAGLRGRGGAWFPTARKLAAVTTGKKRPIVLANGCEGEPASRKDGVLLSVAPQLVLDGAVLAGYAVDAQEAIVCLHQGDPLAATVRAAIAARSGDPVPLRVMEIPVRYTASEESALVNFINTGDARPTSKPPRPFERGVRGRPTLIDNVETLAHLALIARHGPDWFRAVGHPDAPGTTLVTVGGLVNAPGVHEVPTGTPIGEVLALAGGEREPCGAVLVGGYGGGWLAYPEAASAPLRPGAVPLGVGLVAALPARTCGIAETTRLLRYLAGESAAQCGPCMFGLPAVADDFAELADGIAGRTGAYDRLRRRLPMITGRGACGHPDGAVRLASTALRVFHADVRAHLRGAPCAATGLRAVG